MSSRRSHWLAEWLHQWTRRRARAYPWSRSGPARSYTAMRAMLPFIARDRMAASVSPEMPAPQIAIVGDSAIQHTFCSLAEYIFMALLSVSRLPLTALRRCG